VAEAGARARGGGRLFPDGRQTTVLRAALLPKPQALDAWRAAGPWLDPARMDRGSRQLLPLVWANLTGQEVDDPQVGQLAALYQDARVRVDGVLAAAGRVLGALLAAGIPTLVLKGGALVVGYYRGPGVRPRISTRWCPRRRQRQPGRCCRTMGGHRATGGASWAFV
jgi:Uncharacterised nucleotidyltransferase